MFSFVSKKVRIRENKRKQTNKNNRTQSGVALIVSNKGNKCSLKHFIYMSEEDIMRSSFGSVRDGLVVKITCPSRGLGLICSTHMAVYKHL